jgi:hypothetical protein
LQQLHTRFEPIQNRQARRLALVVCSFVAGLGLFSFNPSRVEATCGDYLAHGQNHAQFSLIEEGLIGPGMVDDHPMGQVPRRVPCHGPTCQQAPIQHPLSIPIVNFESQDRWWWTASNSMSSPEQVSFLAPVSEPVVLPMIAFRLDRPPKI